MMSFTLNGITYAYLHTQPQIDDAVNLLANAPSVAFDLEFDRDRYTYGFSLCLIQVSTVTQCFLIDPLAPNISLTGLFTLFENPAIEKIVHCPGEDLRLLHSLKCYPKNLVDTEVYCKLLNYEVTSLSAMLQQHLGVAIDKKMQKSNWHERPLSHAQLAYAAADVVYLHQLREALHPKIVDKGMLAWVNQEFELLETTIHILEPRKDFLKPNDKNYLSQAHQYLLNTLFTWRDETARKLNKPAHHVMPEEVVRDLASERLPIAHLRHTHGVHPYVKGAGINQLNTTWQKALDYIDLHNLSFTKDTQKMSKEAYDAQLATRKQREQWRTTMFVPIQQKLEEAYGTFTMRFLLSTGFVNSLLREEVTFKQLLPAYRQQLVIDTAASLGLDISYWVDTKKIR